MGIILAHLPHYMHSVSLTPESPMLQVPRLLPDGRSAEDKARY
jgi:hypothetical protein